MKPGRKPTMFIEPGKKLGKLTALEFSHKKGSAKYWKFKCDCGKETITRLTMVLNGRTRSCGCLRKEYGNGIFIKNNLEYYRRRL